MTACINAFPILRCIVCCGQNCSHVTPMFAILCRYVEVGRLSVPHLLTENRRLWPIQSSRKSETKVIAQLGSLSMSGKQFSSRKAGANWLNMNL